MATGSEKILSRSSKLLLNKFFDLSTPSMRKVDNLGEKQGGAGEKKKNIMMFIVATNVVASQLPKC